MRYRLVEWIGSGGMAEVFLAQAEGPRGFERTFVVKRILPRLGGKPEFVQMFVDEARIAAQLSHPNIVQTFAFAEPDGIPVLVMEHVDGRDLGVLLRGLAERARAVPPPVVAEIARQCCAALDYAHGRTGPDGAPLGIVHRDVTPSNIMVSWEGHVKLLDFGIARAASSVRRTETAAGTMKGKIGYLAPEQIVDGRVDNRSDLFSLGTVMHEALTGRRLFAADNDLGTLRNVVEMSIDPPSRTNRSVNRTLDRIVMRALCRDPRRRFSSAGLMGRELETYLRGARADGSSVRTFMTEVAPMFRPAIADEGEAAAAASGPQQTIVLDDVDLIPVPPRTTTPTRARTDGKRDSARRRRYALGGAGAAAALLLALAWGFGFHARAGAASGWSHRVEIVLDSSPQGALVMRDADGAVLGQTPIVIELPRGRAPIGLSLQKAGYEPLPFQIIPSQSYPAVAKLAPLPRETDD